MHHLNHWICNDSHIVLYHGIYSNCNMDSAFVYSLTWLCKIELYCRMPFHTNFQHIHISAMETHHFHFTLYTVDSNHNLSIPTYGMHLSAWIHRTVYQYIIIIIVIGIFCIFGVDATLFEWFHHMQWTASAPVSTHSLR